MAFGITKQELTHWKQEAERGEIAFLTHYWYDPRFPQYRTVTKVGCSDKTLLANWCIRNGLDPRYIHHRTKYPHFDLIGPKQKQILKKEGKWDHIERFRL